MATGLIALLDDIAALTKLAAASLDDVAGQAAKAGTKAAGIVIDDTAVTPRYVVGLAADRELPVIRRIALSSLKNKLVLLLPGALALSYFAPWAIAPLLMLGGGFLCLEGFHKAADLTGAGHQHEDEDAAPAAPTTDLKALEQERISSAIRTDFILSAEIMAISLGAVKGIEPWMQAVVLIAVGIGMTVGVYGLVALIVKADDLGLALARSRSAALGSLGRGIVAGMPPFLKILSIVGMMAMLWVGGGIIIHGAKELGWPRPEELIHHAATAAAAGSGAIAWTVQAAISGLFGLALGAALDRLYRTAGARFR